MQNILTVNSYKKKGRYDTNDYVNLKDILKLEYYKLSLIPYPCVANIAPFAGWDSKKPSVSLKWYNAYNAIKHDRIVNQSEATLENAINAVCAVAILLIAQYGMNNSYWKNKMQKFFDISEGPDWQYTDLYIPPVWGTDFVERKYNFRKTEAES